jgi:hypothetical protein
MSQSNPYEQLGIEDSASFEDIQAAKQRLQAEFQGNPQRLEQVEAAYDSILMDRLKLRQEGKINIPEGIRFPEKSLQTLSLPKISPPELVTNTSWIEVASGRSLGIASATIAGLALLVALPQSDMGTVSTALAIALGFTVVSLRSKSNRLGRAALLAGLALVGAIGLTFVAVDVAHLPTGTLGSDRLAALVTLVALWLLSVLVK